MTDSTQPTRIAELYSEMAEQAVLGAIVLDPECLDVVRAKITAESFARKAHSAIFSACCGLVDTGSAIDPLTLVTWLTDHGDLDRAGGIEYVHYLVDVIPTAANVLYHVGIVTDLAARRGLVRLAHAMAENAMDRRLPVAAIAQEATAGLLPTASASAATGFRHIRDLAYEVMQDIEDAVNGKAAGLSFGYRCMDRATGGQQRGELLMLGSVPGAGKTAAAINIAVNAAERGEGVAFVSAEMKDRALAKRILSNRARVNGMSLRTGQMADREFVDVGADIGTWNRLPLWIDDTATPDISLIVARSRALKAKHPELAWLMVDFIQLIGSERDSDEVRSLALTNIAYALKGLAKTLDVAVIATFQVDASGIEKRSDKRPQLSDQRWSQGMREAADMMALAYRPAMYSDDAEDVIELDFKKCRDLPPFKVTLEWVGKFMRIQERTQYPAAFASRLPQTTLEVMA